MEKVRGGSAACLHRRVAGWTLAVGGSVPVVAADFDLVVRLLVEGCRLLAAIFRPAMHYEAMPDDCWFWSENQQQPTHNQQSHRAAVLRISRPAQVRDVSVNEPLRCLNLLTARDH